jgi:hypothetical protein
MKIGCGEGIRTPDLKVMTSSREVAFFRTRTDQLLLVSLSVEQAGDGTFKPRISGNPGGRPTGSVSIVTRIKRKFEDAPQYFEEWVGKLLEDLPNATRDIIVIRRGAWRSIGVQVGPQSTHSNALYRRINCVPD